MKPVIDTDLIKDALNLAESWQDNANKKLTPREKKFLKRLSLLISHPTDKFTLARLIDQGFRSKKTGRTARHLRYIFKRSGVPNFFSPFESLLLYILLTAGRLLPGLFVPLMMDKIRLESSRMVIPGEKDFLHTHLKNQKHQGFHVNINHLGEAVLGEEEALHRLQTYISDLKHPDTEAVSVKISTICSHIDPLAFEHTVSVLVDRLSHLYQTASEYKYRPLNGPPVPKLVYLDMEEYRDLHLTVSAFTQALDQPAFQHVTGGIVLQAYLPDSFAIMKQLTQWALARTSLGGAPIRIRLVKGANMEMEQVESSLRNWPPAPYDSKPDVDANFKRMVHYGMEPEHIQSVHLGIASHNLFDLAYAFQLARRNKVESRMSIEMLEGMADHVLRAVSETTGNVLIYAPTARKEEFINAVGYLIRRLDENTGSENFLRYAPDLETGTASWNRLKHRFLESCVHMSHVSDCPRRTQDRSREVFPERMGTCYNREFSNEPDTDWALPANRKWAKEIRRRWEKSNEAPPLQIPIVIGEKEIYQRRDIRTCLDPSKLPNQVPVAVWRPATPGDIDRAVSIAKNDPDGWRSISPDQRHLLLSKTASELRKSRGELIGAAAAATGKMFTEADPEVSEAIDFVEYYPFSTRTFTRIPSINAAGRGVGIVISPWNFPIAIPCGGITAALASGNTVLFKPASDAVPVGWVLCQAFWNAGISRNVLQFIPCAGNVTGHHLISRPDVNFVILTGGTDTGLGMLKENPGMFLSAETGGKNATIVTAMSDRDQAIRHVIYSAFGNSGQKCSATSLLILEKEVYQDENFKRRLIDAARSFRTGSAWKFESRMGPLIRPPSGALKKALTTLEPQESWALRPEMIHDNPHLWTPGIKWNVQPGSFTHRTEFFGPLLGVMKASDLAHAVRLVNMTGYGLTCGLESLDEQEQAFWENRIQAGNLYINRITTGAVTLRQPFGGMGKSALGPAIKAGSPNYVSQFMTFEETGFPETGAIEPDHPLLRMAQQWEQKLNWGLFATHETDLRRTVRAVKSYLYHARQEFEQEKDYFHLRGQDNRFRYRPLGTIVVCLHEHDTLFDILARIAASKIAGNATIVSIPGKLDTVALQFFKMPEGRQFLEGVAIRRQPTQELIGAMALADRFRYAAPDRVPLPVMQAAARAGFYIAADPVLMEGRIELIHYYRNQSVSFDYHRYGNLGERAVF